MCCQPAPLAQHRLLLLLLRPQRHGQQPGRQHQLPPPLKLLLQAQQQWRPTLQSLLPQCLALQRLHCLLPPPLLLTLALLSCLQRALLRSLQWRCPAACPACGRAWPSSSTCAAAA